MFRDCHIFFCGSGIHRGVTKAACTFRCLGSGASEDGYQKFEYSVHERYVLVVGGVMGFIFVGLVNEFGGAVAPFFRSEVVILPRVGIGDREGHVPNMIGVCGFCWELHLVRGLCRPTLCGMRRCSGYS